MKIILKLLAAIFVTLPLKINAVGDGSSSQGSGLENDDSYRIILTKLKDKENQFEFDSGEKRSRFERDTGRKPSFYRVDRLFFNSVKGVKKIPGRAFDHRFSSTRCEIDEEACLNGMLEHDENAACLCRIVDDNEGLQLVVHKVTDRTTWGLEIPVKIDK